MNTKTNIEQQVMGSVAAVYAARRFASPFMLKVYALALSVTGVALLVSLSHVGANLMAVESHGALAVGVFILSAVLGTSIVVQIALAVGAAASLSLAADATRSLRSLPARQGRVA